MGVSKDPSCSGKGRNRYGFVLCRIRLFQQHYRAWDVPAWLYGRCRRLSNHPLFSRTQILIAFPTECFSCLSGIFFCQRVKFIRLFEPNARGGVTIFLQLILASRVILLKMTSCLLGRCSPIPANAEQALRLSGTVQESNLDSAAYRAYFQCNQCSTILFSSKKMNFLLNFIHIAS